MKLSVFGVGSASPQLDKHASSFLLSIENEHILIDCGEGTQYRLLENKIKRSRLRTICISHLHGDHYFGLVGLLSSLSLNNRTEPMTIIGPKGLNEILNIQFKYANTSLRYELNFIETKTNGRNLVFDNGVFKIESFPLIHRVPCTGFLLSKYPGQRHILAHKLPANFPIPFIHQLKKGLDVTDPISGKTYFAKKLTSKGAAALSFAYCSDTAYNPDMIPVIKNANLIYHETTFTEKLKERASLTQHSTAKEAAMIAKQAGVKRMLMGHLSSRYKTSEEHLLEARAIFKNCDMAIEGAVYEIN